VVVLADPLVAAEPDGADDKGDADDKEDVATARGSEPAALPLLLA